MPQNAPKEIVNECVQSCIQAFITCTETRAYCLQKAGEHADEHHICLLELCSCMTELTAKSMILNSPYDQLILDACAGICRACADDCRHMDDAFMRECAEVCELCADQCSELTSPRPSFL